MRILIIIGLLLSSCGSPTFYTHKDMKIHSFVSRSYSVYHNPIELVDSLDHNSDLYNTNTLVVIKTIKEYNKSFKITQQLKILQISLKIITRMNLLMG